MPRTNMQPTTGLYVRYKDVITVFILLAISRTYGCSTPNYMYYGKNCSLPCPDRCKNSRCYIKTGHCLGCENGYQGLTCEQPCQNNTYGAGCSKKCGHCLNKEQCNHIKGTCNNGCEAGYYTPRCKKECKKGTFGEKCATICGHCKDEEACDKETGACPSGCQRWYEGIYCNQSCQTVYYGPHCVLICNSSCPHEMCYSEKEDCLQENYQSSGKEDCGNMKLLIAIGGSVGVLSVVIHVVALVTSNKRKSYSNSGKKDQTSSLLSQKSINCESAQNDNIQINTCQEEPSTQTSGFYMELMESQYQNTAEHIYEQAQEATLF